MKISRQKKFVMMDIYLRLAGFEIKGATDCLSFVPESIPYGDNVVQLFNAGGEA